jgi:hypothetical protein
MNAHVPDYFTAGAFALGLRAVLVQASAGACVGAPSMANGAAGSI